MRTNLRILFIRPPRYYWPMNSESSSFWQPLGFASIAAVLREKGFSNVKILDCLALKIGWKSLKKILDSHPADVICVGDETASFHEAVKLINYVKKVTPIVKCVAGGYHFANTIKESFSECDVDFIIKGEGEYTTFDLMKVLDYNKNNKKQKSFNKIQGLAFRNSNNRIIINKPRELIKNLDELPFPAYDLLPMHLYGNKSKNHQDFIALEHGRGCTGGCSFCSIWPQMAKHNSKGIDLPCYRTKSPKRCYEETKFFVEKYNRKTINWVDGTFNLDTIWSKEYFRLLKKNNIFVQHTAWVRADCVVRDEKLGILKQMVEGGLVQVVIGLERLDDKKLKSMNKKGITKNITLSACEILKKYNSVYTIGSIIYGLPDDDKTDLNNILKTMKKNITDFYFVLPYTPFPGTIEWNKYKNKFNSEVLKRFNLQAPIFPTKHLSIRQLNFWFIRVLFSYNNFRNAIIKINSKNKRTRNLTLSLFKKLHQVLFYLIFNKLFLKNNIYKYGIKPKWYDK